MVYYTRQIRRPPLGTRTRVLRFETRWPQLHGLLHTINRPSPPESSAPVLHPLPRLGVSEHRSVVPLQVGV